MNLLFRIVINLNLTCKDHIYMQLPVREFFYSWELLGMRASCSLKQFYKLRPTHGLWNQLNYLWPAFLFSWNSKEWKIESICMKSIILWNIFPQFLTYIVYTMSPCKIGYILWIIVQRVQKPLVKSCYSKLGPRPLVSYLSCPTHTIWLYIPFLLLL